MEREEGDSAGVGSNWESICGGFISLELPGIGSTQETMLEDSLTLKFSDSLINLWELDALAVEDLKGVLFDVTGEMPLELLDAAL